MLRNGNKFCPERVLGGQCSGAGGLGGKRIYAFEPESTGMKVHIKNIENYCFQIYVIIYK
jgi:hypothetical protein